MRISPQRQERNPARSASERLPVVCGSDFELANFFLGADLPRGTGAPAARALLSRFDGLPLRPDLWREGQDLKTVCASESQEGQGNANPSTANALEWGRKFLPANGGCAYIDMNHLELCTPEVISAYDHVACFHAMLRLARTAVEEINAEVSPRYKVVALANNSDGLGHSYGSHLDFLISRRAWNNLFNRQMHGLLFLASYQASSIIFTGQGKVGSENGRPRVDYQVSQRADFFEMLLGLQTTHNRPVVNSRNEALCGGYAWCADQVGMDQDIARLHVIFYDNALCHSARLLAVGVMQITLAMIQEQAAPIDLILEDPVTAVHCWSHDPSLRARAKLCIGGQWTAAEWQLAFFEKARTFVEQGGCEGIVPDAEAILALWGDTLQKLDARDFDALRPRLDWVLKKSILEEALGGDLSIAWDMPEIKHLDHMYSSVEGGLYWAYEESGAVERQVTESRIQYFEGSPPVETRAWARAMLLRKAREQSPSAVSFVDWDTMTLLTDDSAGWKRSRTVRMPHPLGHTRTHCEDHFQSGDGLDETILALDSEGARRFKQPTQGHAL
jgi:proteasome accessory factor A